MQMFHSIAGMVEVEITSADPAALLESLGATGIIVHHVRPQDDVTFRFFVLRRDYRKVRQIVQRRGDPIKILHRTGIYWRGKGLVQRPVLLIGMSILLFLLLFLPTRVLFLEVEGNNRIPERLILEAAENCGIRFWASRREVRSERVKNQLLHAVPQLKWAGVNTYGCVAVISVQERSDTTAKEEMGDVCSIVALREGIVISCNATNGNLLCQPGQAVKAGQVLISGYTDCGLTIQATRAKGEVYGRTVREISLISPVSCLRKGEIKETKGSYSMIFGKKRINLWKDSGIWDTTCDRIYEEYYVTLPGGFRLPIGVALEEFRFYETEAVFREETEVQSQMEASASRYIREQMIAGRIQDQNVSLTFGEDAAYLAGKYICTEMIGKVQWEQIGESNGKSG